MSKLQLYMFIYICLHFHNYTVFFITKTKYFVNHNAVSYSGSNDWLINWMIDWMLDFKSSFTKSQTSKYLWHHIFVQTFSVDFKELDYKYSKY